MTDPDIYIYIFFSWTHPYCSAAAKKFVTVAEFFIASSFIEGCEVRQTRAFNVQLLHTEVTNEDKLTDDSLMTLFEAES